MRAQSLKGLGLILYYTINLQLGPVQYIYSLLFKFKTKENLYISELILHDYVSC